MSQVKLTQIKHMALWDDPKSKITCFCVQDSNTVINLLDSIPRFLVCWLGPSPVNWMSPVRIPLKSLVTYILLKFLKNGCFCFSIIPIWIHNIHCHPMQTDTFQPYTHMNIDNFMNQYL